MTERESVSSSGEQANYGADLPTCLCRGVSDDGRFVAFTSSATNLVSGDNNGTWDVFVRDRARGKTELVSVSTSGGPGNGVSGAYGVTLSPNGRFVAFDSRATTLVQGDSNGRRDIFLRDLWNGTTERISVSSSGAQANGDSWYPSISEDGRYVAFLSMATNLVTGDTNGADDVFVRDRRNGITERVSVPGAGGESNGGSSFPNISADGRFVTYISAATNLVSGDTNATWDVFLHDRVHGTIERVNVGPGGAEANATSGSTMISQDGRFIAFTSVASNLVTGDTNGGADIFVRDLASGTTELVSIGIGGSPANGNSDFSTLSSDGRFVAFSSNASNLIAGGSNGYNIFVRDRLDGTTELVSVTTEGTHVHIAGHNELPSISDNGRYVVFRSLNRDLVPGDSNGYTDVFLHDRTASGFERVCNPGIDGVTFCPCSNPPSGTDRGCDNSAMTGGASLSATGIAYLSIDSLRFSTTGEPANAPSVLFQGTAAVGSGLAYGQGVRCVSGRMIRLYTRLASGGGVTVPDLGSGDATVSTRSRLLGEQIVPGVGFWYFVAYRDPTVLGGCPAESTFNATQAGRVEWWP